MWHEELQQSARRSVKTPRRCAKWLVILLIAGDCGGGGAASSQEIEGARHIEAMERTREVRIRGVEVGEGIIGTTISWRRPVSRERASLVLLRGTDEGGTIRMSEIEVRVGQPFDADVSGMPEELLLSGDDRTICLRRRRVMEYETAWESIPRPGARAVGVARCVKSGRLYVLLDSGEVLWTEYQGEGGAPVGWRSLVLAEVLPASVRKGGIGLYRLDFRSYAKGVTHLEVAPEVEPGQDCVEIRHPIEMGADGAHEIVRLIPGRDRSAAYIDEVVLPAGVEGVDVVAQAGTTVYLVAAKSQGIAQVVGTAKMDGAPGHWVRRRVMTPAMQWGVYYAVRTSWTKLGSYPGGWRTPCKVIRSKATLPVGYEMTCFRGFDCHDTDSLGVSAAITVRSQFAAEAPSKIVLRLGIGVEECRRQRVQRIGGTAILTPDMIMEWNVEKTPRGLGDCYEILEWISLPSGEDLEGVLYMLQFSVNLGTEAHVSDIVGMPVRTKGIGYPAPNSIRQEIGIGAGWTGAAVTPNLGSEIAERARGALSRRFASDDARRVLSRDEVRACLAGMIESAKKRRDDRG